MAADADNTLYMDVPFGRVVIEMRPELAPNHCAQIKALARRGFYDGVPFHRVIEGFMVQTGDPTGTGTGGSGHSLRAEFNSEKHVRGTTSMAFLLAISPAAWPPMPSATMHTDMSGNCFTSIESSLFSR